MPEPTGIEFQDFCCNLPAMDIGDVTPDSRSSTGLRQRDDHPELPSAGPERDGTEVSALTETNVGRSKVQERPLDMFP
ncbi:hypothetical protein [Arthrobacter sp. B3I9]|uniref:hypothetical protein n=1 Tax=Arthrobacter sp. B3I9 TaxID=3042270 RepID=UPI0027D8EDFE|nr:hypothetical protein [Arthrobacter sp. B3I9]